MSQFIVEKRIYLIIAFIILTGLSVLLIPKVEVNDNHLDYFPEDSDIVLGYTSLYTNFIVEEENVVKVMSEDMTVLEAIAFKDEISTINGISKVTYIDDAFSDIVDPIANATQIDDAVLSLYLFDILMVLPDDLTQIVQSEIEPIIQGLHSDQSYFIFLGALDDTLDNLYQFDPATLTTFSIMKGSIANYVEGSYHLFSVTMIYGDNNTISKDAVLAINDLEDHLVFSGSTADYAFGRIETVSDTATLALMIGFGVVLIILMLFSTSYFEPIIFLITIGIGILINMGTNYFFGEISSITSSVAPVMQLALTIDYSIFLVTRYKNELKLGLTDKEAMTKAIKMSFSPVSASSMTTLASFVALMFMQYAMGGDIGLILGKGVLISLITVFTLLPALMLVCRKIIKKTEHKPLHIHTKVFSKVLFKLRYVLPVLGIGIVAVGLTISRLNAFEYGDGQDDTTAINDVFESENTKQLVLLYEQGLDGITLENFNYNANSYDAKLTAALSQIEHVKSVTSYTYYVESGYLNLGLDQETLGELVANFNGPNGYSRVIINYDSSEVLDEGDDSVDFFYTLQDKVEEVFAGEEDASFYFVGTLAVNVNMREISEKDYTVTQTLSFIFILIILFLTFKSLILPFILVLIIQGAIGYAMLSAVVLGEPLQFIAYLLVSAVLLGATIDYAILVTSHYLENREKYGRLESMQLGLENSLHSLMPSAVILFLSGIVLTLTSSERIVSMFGILIAGGALTSFVLIALLLPTVLILLDKVIMKTMYKGSEKMIKD